MMATTCTHCDGTGFLNINQVPATVEAMGIGAIDQWMTSHADHDVQVCDCCGNGGVWHGIPGEHYNEEDPRGYVRLDLGRDSLFYGFAGEGRYYGADYDTHKSQ